MARFWTADLHVSHKNIITYSDRKFSDVEEMNIAIVEEVNSTVGEDDTLIVLGDVALGKLDESLAWISLLNGNIELWPGNHDKCWLGNKKIGGWEERYLEAGFSVIHHGVGELEVGGKKVLLSHFPYRGDSQEVDRYGEWRPKDHGQWLIHGHVHERWRQSGKMINVGIDAWGGKVVSEAQIIELMDAGPNDLDRIEWPEAA